MYNRYIYIKKNFKNDERPPCHVIINGEHDIYFWFLKGFIDIPFVKNVHGNVYENVFVSGLALELPLYS